jgi:beta propeller repeat protein
VKKQTILLATTLIFALLLCGAVSAADTTTDTTTITPAVTASVADTTPVESEVTSSPTVDTTPVAIEATETASSAPAADTTTVTSSDTSSSATVVESTPAADTTPAESSASSPAAADTASTVPVAETTPAAPEVTASSDPISSDTATSAPVADMASATESPSAEAPAADTTNVASPASTSAGSEATNPAPVTETTSAPVVYTKTVASETASLSVMSDSTALATLTAEPVILASESLADPQENTAPTAVIKGPSSHVDVNTVVQLDGTGSTDPEDGSVTSYSWTLQVPSGSTATLDDNTSPTPKFTPDVSGDYLTTLTVTDSQQLSSNPATYTITAQADDSIPITTNHADQTRPAIYGDKIVWADSRNGNYDIYMYDLSTGVETQITTAHTMEYEPFPAIYGDKIVWTDDRNWIPAPDGGYYWNSDIYMYNISTGVETQLTTFQNLNYNVAIYGDRIVYEQWDYGVSNIYTMDISTGAVKQLTFSEFPNDNESPDIYGDKIVWTDYNYNIIMYDLSTSAETQITTNPSDKISLYPDIYGDKIVWQEYNVNYSNSYDIYMYDLSTGIKKQLTTNPKNQVYPAIYGDTIVWEDMRNGYQDPMHPLHWVNPDIYMKRLTPVTTNQAPTAVIKIDPENPMVGGYIEFDATASSDPDGSIVKYEWDFNNDGVTDSTDVKPYYEYTFPQSYTVKLTVTDNGDLKTSTTKDLDLSLLPGDIIAVRSPNSLVPGSTWTHVALVLDNSHVIEALPGGVQIRPLSEYFYDPQNVNSASYVGAFRVLNDAAGNLISQTVRTAAVGFALSQVGKPYDHNLLLKELNGPSWYCSELIWAAYYHASDGSIVLDTNDWVFSVHPEEVVSTKNPSSSNHYVTKIGEHIEDPWVKTFWGQALIGVSHSPVDLIITDPDGLVLSKTSQMIPGGFYQEADYDNNNNVEDIFYIGNPKEGNYQITVIPESSTSTGTYSLDIGLMNADGTVISVDLAKDVLVSQDPQTFTINSSGIIIEKLPPNVSASLSGGSYNSPQTVSLTSAEPANIIYSTDGTTWNTYQGPITIKKEGTTTLQYKATDTVGNPSQIQTITYTIDTTPPVVTVLPNGGTYNSAQTVTLKAIDSIDQSPVIKYTTDGTTWNTYQSPITVNKAGTTTLQYYATDSVGNPSTTQTVTYTINTQPTCPPCHHKPPVNPPCPHKPPVNPPCPPSNHKPPSPPICPPSPHKVVQHHR